MVKSSPSSATTSSGCRWISNASSCLEMIPTRTCQDSHCPRDPQTWHRWLCVTCCSAQRVWVRCFGFFLSVFSLPVQPECLSPYMGSFLLFLWMPWVICKSPIVMGREWEIHFTIISKPSKQLHEECLPWGLQKGTMARLHRYLQAIFHPLFTLKNLHSGKISTFVTLCFTL